ncbi:MAG: class I SAM-dependent methyltransferase [Microgenomates group bacterium]
MKQCSICLNKKIILAHKKNIYLYFLCYKCQTLFLNPQPSQKAIIRYYKNNFEYSAGCSNKTKIIRQAKKILKNLKKLNPNGKTLLDIGCGFGYFLREAKKAGFQVEGVEPSNKLTTQLIKSLKLQVTNFSFEEYFKRNKEKKKFDFITMIHVIEHIKNPKKWIEMASSLLKENGILYIETPNLQSHLYNVEKENYTFLTPPDHLWIFSQQSFQTLIKKIPKLKINKMSTYSYPEHLMGIIKKLLTKKNVIPAKAGIYKDKMNKFLIKSPETTKNILISDIKYYFFDRILATLFTPLLNIGGYGSILELYIKKK